MFSNPNKCMQPVAAAIILWNVKRWPGATATEIVCCRDDTRLSAIRIAQDLLPALPRMHTTSMASAIGDVGILQNVNGNRSPLWRQPEIVCRWLLKIAIAGNTCIPLLPTECVGRHDHHVCNGHHSPSANILLPVRQTSSTLLSTTPSNGDSFALLSDLHVFGHHIWFYLRKFSTSILAKKGWLSKNHSYSCMCSSPGKVYKHTTIKYCSICRNRVQLAI